MITKQLRFDFEEDETLDEMYFDVENHLHEFRKAKWFGVDIETYGSLDPRVGKIRLIQICLEDRILVADFGGYKNPKEHPEFINILCEKLEDPSVVKIGHNLKFDCGFFLWKFGARSRNLRDTMLMSQTLWSIGGQGEKYRHDLGALAKRFELEADKSEQKSDWGWDLTNKQLNYAANDVRVTVELAKRLKKALQEEDKKYGTNLWNTAMVENEALPAFIEMEFHGMPVDEEILSELENSYEKARDRAILPFATEFPDVNPRSPLQVNAALNEKYGLGLGAEDEDNKFIQFRNQHIPSVKSLMTYKSLSTQVGTSFPQIRENFFDGAVRSHYTQIARKGTGRSSSKRPNLQNAANFAPEWRAMGLKHPRSMFRAPSGYKLIITDLSQAHARIAAEFSQDEIMCEAYRDYRDLHAITASNQAQVRGLGLDWTPENILRWRKDDTHPHYALAESLRKTSKNVNYGSLNAQGAKTFQRTMMTARDSVFVELDECKKMLEAWKGFYATLSLAQRKIFDEGNNYDISLPGLSGSFGQVIGLSGRRVFFQKFLQYRWVNGEKIPFWGIKFTDAISSVWLGTEAHIVKRALGLLMKEIDQRPEWDWRLANMAHDEIDSWVKEDYATDAAQIQINIMDECMKEWIKTIPVNEKDISPEMYICDSWSEK